MPAFAVCGREVDGFKYPSLTQHVAGPCGTFLVPRDTISTERWQWPRASIIRAAGVRWFSAVFASLVSPRTMTAKSFTWVDGPFPLIETSHWTSRDSVRYRSLA